MFENVKRLMDERISLGIPGNDVIIYKDGRELFRSWRGYSDAENKIPMTGKELYNVYSCSKPITCTAGMMLVERGVISLDEPLSRFMPEFESMNVKTADGKTVPAENPIKIKHLFTMSAGFSYDVKSPSLIEARERTGGTCPTVETLRRLAKEPLLFEPGTAFKYSLCHDVLAAVIEIASGVRFGEFVKRNIFMPLGMESSTYNPREVNAELLAAQYIYDIDTETRTKIGAWDNELRLGLDYESGGAGCVTTADDYMKFIEGLRTGKLIKPETIALMTANTLPEMQDSSEYWHEGYGYGLGVRCAKSPDSHLADLGWDGAAGSYMALDMKNSISVFYAQHVRGSHIAYRQNELIKAIYLDLGI